LIIEFSFSLFLFPSKLTFPFQNLRFNISSIYRAVAQIGKAARPMHVSTLADLARLSLDFQLRSFVVDFIGI
jgi:hypothetical protein